MQKKQNGEHYTLTYSEHPTESRVLFESHCHAQYELIAVTEGSILLSAEGAQRSLTAGDVIIIPPLLYHSIVVERACTYRRVTLLFEEAIVPLPIIEAIFSKASALSVVGTAMLSLLERVASVIGAAYYTPLLESLLIQLFYEYAEAKERAAEGVGDDFLRTAIAYIEKHLCEPISLDALAAKTARSKSSLCHLFRERMNVSVKQYILQKRLALADKLMHEGVSPTVAAARVGYENYSNFYRMYRKRFGRSPSEG